LVVRNSLKISKTSSVDEMLDYKMSNFKFSEMFPFIRKNKRTKQYNAMSFEDLENFKKVEKIIKAFDIELTGEDQLLYRYLFNQYQLVKYDPMLLFTIKKVWKEQLKRLEPIKFGDNLDIKLENRMFFPVKQAHRLLNQYVKDVTREQVDTILDMAISENHRRYLVPVEGDIRNLKEFGILGDVQNLCPVIVVLENRNDAKKIYGGFDKKKNKDNLYNLFTTEQEISNRIHHFDIRLNDCFDGVSLSNPTNKRKIQNPNRDTKRRITRKEKNKKPIIKKDLEILKEKYGQQNFGVIKRVYSAMDLNLYSTMEKLDSMYLS